jgi:hypothetical protein
MTEQKEKKEKIVREREREKQKKQNKEKQKKQNEMNELHKWMMDQIQKSINAPGNEDWLVFDEVEEALEKAPYHLKEPLTEDEIDYVVGVLNKKFGARLIS